MIMLVSMVPDNIQNAEFEKTHKVLYSKCKKLKKRQFRRNEKFDRNIITKANQPKVVNEDVKTVEQQIEKNKTFKIYSCLSLKLEMSLAGPSFVTMLS